MTAALILAAGRGTRFGGGKMLADIDGQPMLQHVLDLAAAAELNPVVVVVGDDADEIESAMTWRNEMRLRNDDPRRGLSSSVGLGLAALAGDTVLVLLGDQPFLTVENVHLITSASLDPKRPIVVPRYSNGEPGNPVRLEQEAHRLASGLTGDSGMSQLFKSRPDLVRYVDVAGRNPDIDTQSDAEAISRA